MDIRTALDQVVTIQAGLAITSPITATIKKAWKYMAPQEQLAPDCPCWMNTWRMDNEDRSPSMRVQFYVVNMQLFTDDADQERAADIATAFHVALVDALDAKLTLSGAVKQQTLRGGDPSLAILERGGRAYVGLNLFLDIILKEGKDFAV